MCVCVLTILANLTFPSKSLFCLQKKDWSLVPVLAGLWGTSWSPSCCPALRLLPDASAQIRRMDSAGCSWISEQPREWGLVCPRSEPRGREFGGCSSDSSCHFPILHPIFLLPLSLMLYLYFKISVSPLWNISSTRIRYTLCLLLCLQMLGQGLCSLTSFQCWVLSFRSPFPSFESGAFPFMLETPPLFHVALQGLPSPPSHLLCQLML